MKILMVSMFSLHFFRWAEQLKGCGHEVFWIDVYDSNTTVENIDFIHQYVGWRTRWKYPGRYWLKKRWPLMSKFLSYCNDRDLADFVDQQILKVKPNVIHSFVMQSATLPLNGVMKKYPDIKWIYSAWGNDLYFRKQNKKDLREIQETLPNIDFMFADCTRDYFLARELGFKGKYLGTFPTGGGYALESFLPYVKNIEEKDCIVIKGYQGKLGRCTHVLEALIELKELLSELKIVLFAVNNEVIQYAHQLGLTKWDNFVIKPHLTHHEVLKLMGAAKIYIGNSISDGLPNTLLEAILMEAFPIQSNPGGATSELIANGKNGLLIDRPEDSKHIATLIEMAITNEEMMKNAIDHNSKNIRPFLDRNIIKEEVQQKYRYIVESL